MLIESIELTKENLWSDGAKTETFRSFLSGGNSFAAWAVKGIRMKLSDIKWDVKDISL